MSRINEVIWQPILCSHPCRSVNVHHPMPRDGHLLGTVDLVSSLGDRLLHAVVLFGGGANDIDHSDAPYDPNVWVLDVDQLNLNKEVVDYDREIEQEWTPIHTDTKSRCLWKCVPCSGSVCRPVGRFLPAWCRIDGHNSEEGKDEPVPSFRIGLIGGNRRNPPEREEDGFFLLEFRNVCS